MALALIFTFLALVSAVPFSVCSSQQDYKEIYPPVNISTTDPSSHLFFALVQSFGGPYNGSGNVPAIKVALDRINNSTDILPNHTLHYTLTDSQVRKI